MNPKQRYKFRVWDITRKEYLKEYCNTGLFFIYSGQANNYVHENIPITRFLQPEYKNKFIVEQSTGVKDYNNKNKYIYEGDIVYLNKFNGDEINMRNLYEIKFNHGSFVLHPIKLGDEHKMKMIKTINNAVDDIEYSYEMPAPESIYDYNICAVGGNIHTYKKDKKDER